jgi:hypothetical protein
MDFSWIFHAKIKSRDSIAADGQYRKNNSCWYLRDIFFFLFQLLDNDDEKNLKKWNDQKKKTGNITTVCFSFIY